MLIKESKERKIKRKGWKENWCKQKNKNQKNEEMVRVGMSRKGLGWK